MQSRTLGRWWMSIACLAVLVATSVGHAQGTSGTLPDPINTPELHEYAEQLGLSDQQILAAETIHDEYKAQFRRLRDGDIQEFLQAMRTMGGGLPTKQQLDDFLRSLKTVSASIAAIDNRMFDRLQPLLAEQQLIQLDRVRMRRARKRVMSQQMTSGLTGVTLADLSELVRPIELETEQAEIVDSILHTYERRLTGDMTRLGEQSMTLIAKMFDDVVEAGYTAEAIEQDPQLAMKMQEVVMESMARHSAKLRDSAADLRKLSLTTFDRIAPHLPITDRTQLRAQLVQSLYPMSWGIGGAGEDPYARLLATEELTAAERTELEDLHLAFDAEIDGLFREAIKVLEEVEANRMPMNPNMGEAMTELQEKMAEVGQKAAGIHGRAVEAIHAAIGEQRASDVVTAAARRARTTAPAIPPPTVAQSLEAVRVDPMVPMPISTREIDGYCDWLGLSDDARAVVATLHDAYRERCGDARQTQSQQLNEARGKLWRHDPETGQFEIGSRDDAAGLAKLRQSFIDAIRAADVTLFEDIAVAVLDDTQQEDLQRVRDLRTREICRPQQYDPWANQEFASQSSKVDLAELLRDIDAALIDDEAIDEILRRYERELTTALEQRFDAALHYQKQMDIWSLESSRASQSGETIDWSTMYNELMTGAQETMQTRDLAVRGINDAALAELQPLLPTDVAGRLRRLYQRTAYPHVYADFKMTESRLEAARELSDLSSQQRADIEDLLLDYRPAMSAICDELLRVSDAMPSTMGMSTDWQAYQAAQDELARLRFDRDELSQRVERRLKSLLSEEQLHRVRPGG